MSILQVEMSDREFMAFRQLIHKVAGIAMSDAKRQLLVGRLSQRLRHLGLESFSAYYRYVTAGQDPVEWQQMIDLLTTHETYFFREEKHFEWLAAWARSRVVTAPSLWSAACSTGEEVYTLAMVLADVLGLGATWSVTGTDISEMVVEAARRGHYDDTRSRGLPETYRKKYCLKGRGAQAGTFLMDRQLREHTNFAICNLMEPMSGGDLYDVIFLRNVMIYFDPETKREVVQKLMMRLKPQGYLVVGHSESLNGLVNGLRQVKPTIYTRAA